MGFDKFSRPTFEGISYSCTIILEVKYKYCESICCTNVGYQRCVKHNFTSHVFRITNLQRTNI